MKKYLQIRFKIYYIFTVLLYFFYPILLLLRDFIPSTNEDKSMFNQTIGFFMTIFLILLYLIAIIPTVELLKLNSKEKYWYNAPFKKDKVYGKIRVAIKINILIFITTQVFVCFLNYLNKQAIVSEFFWIPIVVFLLLSGVSAIMAGIYLEIKSHTKASKF